MKLIFRMISRGVTGLLAMIAAQTLARSFKDKIGTPAPDFLPSPANFTFNKGELAVLHCSVFNLGTRTVVWRKLDNSFPLTSGTLTIVPDDRIHVGHVQARNQWDLMIKNVQLTDKGIYECQVASTDRSFRRLVVLTVLDLKDTVPEIKIIGPQYIEWDESFVLQCNATSKDHAPDEMDWFKDGHKISSDVQKRIKIAKQYSISSRSFSSTLQIDRASMDDSGIYVCRSSNNQITSIKLHVLNASEGNKGGVMFNSYGFKSNPSICSLNFPKSTVENQTAEAETFNRKRGTVDNESDAVGSASAVSDSTTLAVLTVVMFSLVLFER